MKLVHKLPKVSFTTYDLLQYDFRYSDKPYASKSIPRSSILAKRACTDEDDSRKGNKMLIFITLAVKVRTSSIFRKMVDLKKRIKFPIENLPENDLKKILQ